MTSDRTILPRRRRLLQALLAAAVLVLAACETPGLRDDPAALEDRARAQQEAGNYRAAAQTYERLASRDPDRRDGYLLAAAESWYLHGERNRAMYNMRSVRQPFPASMSLAQQVMAAAIDVEAGRHNDALGRLRSLPPDPPGLIATDALAVGARAWFGLGQPRRAVEALVEREGWLEGPDERLANQRLIWEGLRGAGQAPVPEDADPVIAGWLALGNAVAETAGDAFGERAALLGWRTAWPDHPAIDVLLSDLLEGSKAIRVPQRVALLLPLSGRLESVGAALRDGFIAAYFDYGEAVAGSEIVFYDTVERGAAAAYRQAVEGGADFIVGPLLKDDVAEITPLVPAGPVTLALNYLPDDTQAPRNLFQFALAPEHEAERVAQRAVAEGQQRAVALVPDSDWGRRLLQAFNTELERLGGQLLSYEFYPNGATDFAAVIQPVLHLDRSHARRRAIAAEVGQSLEFEPRRRQDVDFIFIAAQPTEARLIRPQLRFHYASDLPVYATAAAFRADEELNRDVNGLVFAATPWEIAPTESAAGMLETIDRYWPARAQHRSPLYAMGYDAWRLVPLLAARDNDALNLRGMTGELSMENDGRVRRFPALGRIENGVALPLERLELAAPENPDVETGAEPVLPGGSGSP